MPRIFHSYIKIANVYSPKLGTFWWNPFHYILNGSKDMACWKTYNFFWATLYFHLMQYVSRTCSFKRHNFHVQCTTTTTVLLPLYRSTCVRRHLQLRTGDFVGAKFYRLYAIADGNQRIQIIELTLEFFSTLNSVIYNVSMNVIYTVGWASGIVSGL